MSTTENEFAGQLTSRLGDSLTRRSFIRRAAVLSVSAPIVFGLLSACDDDDDDSPADPGTDEPDDDEDEPDDTDDETDDDDDDSDAPAPSGGAIVVDLGSEPENLDPHQIVAGTTHRLVEQMCETLVRYDSDLGINPWLAEDWEAAEDGMSYTFHLRDDVTFHDGSDFNAEAVKFSFERQLSEDHPFNDSGQWANAARLRYLQEFEVEDDYTLHVGMSEPFPSIMDRLAVNAGARIVSPQAIEELGDDVLEHPVGTGPFKFNRWDQGEQVVIDAFDDYWGGRPSLDQVFFRAIAEDGARQAALLSGEVHLAIEVSPEIGTAVENSDSLYLSTGQTGALWFLAMNVESPPFDDVRVRQAVNHAVDKETIVESILNDTAEIAHGPLSSAYPDYNPEVENYYEFDLDRAAELLEEAGVDPEQEIVFRSSIGGSGMLMPEEMATIIQDDLRNIGLNTRLEVQEFVGWMDAIRDPQNELSVMSWNTPPTEADAMFAGILTESALPPGFNTSYWVNEEFEEMVSIGRSSLDPDESREAYHRAQMIVMEDAPIVPVCHRLQLFGLANRVQGFEALPSIELDLRPVYLED